jgi:hypothetical protein
MANPTKAGKGRNRIKRGPGKRMVDGKSFRLADEVRYIQRRAAAELDSHIVSIGQLVLFSSESGDAWMLDPAEHLAFAWRALGTLRRSISKMLRPRVNTGS